MKAMIEEYDAVTPIILAQKEYRELIKYHSESLKDSWSNEIECYKNVNVASLETKNFCASKVRNMQYMFANCYNLDSLNVSSFNTYLVENLEGMFKKYELISSLNITNFCTNNVVNTAYMFDTCIKLNYIYFNTEEEDDFIY